MNTRQFLKNVIGLSVEIITASEELIDLDREISTPDDMEMMKGFANAISPNVLFVEHIVEGKLYYIPVYEIL